MKNQELAKQNDLYIDIEKSITRIKKKKEKYVYLHKIIRIVVLIAGGIITVLTGWKSEPNEIIDPNIILVLSTSITIATAIESLFDMRDKAMGYDLILYELRKLRDKMCYDYQWNKEQFKQKEIQDKYQKDYETILASQKTIIENSYQNGD